MQLPLSRTTAILLCLPLYLVAACSTRIVCAQEKADGDLHQRQDLVFWESIRDSTNPDMFQAYLEQFPNGVYVKLAQIRLKELGGSQPAKKPAPEATAATPQPSTTESHPVSPEADTHEGSSTVDAANLMEQLRKALGGTEQLKQIKDYQRRYIFKQEKRFGKGEDKSPKYFEQGCRSGQSRVQTSTLMHSFTQYFDGQSSGWLALGNHVSELKPLEVEYARHTDFAFDFLNVALADQRPTRSVSISKPGAVQIVDLDGDVMVLEIDSGTGLPTKETVTFVSKNSVNKPRQEVFSDWRVVSGIKLPFAVQESVDGEKRDDIVVIDWKLNSGIDCGGLGKKP